MRFIRDRPHILFNMLIKGKNKVKKGYSGTRTIVE